jgi:hypothetical protein
MGKKRLTGLKAYQVQRLINDAEQGGYVRGYMKRDGEYCAVPFLQRLRFAFTGKL